MINIELEMFEAGMYKNKKVKDILIQDINYIYWVLDIFKNKQSNFSNLVVEYITGILGKNIDKKKI